MMKGDTFSDFLFAFLYTSPLLKRELCLKERMCSLRLHLFTLNQTNGFGCVLLFFFPEEMCKSNEVKK